MGTHLGSRPSSSLKSRLASHLTSRPGNRQWHRPSRRDETGAAAVEFALVLPLLLMLVFGIISFGMIFGNHLALSNGTRQAARSGVVLDRDCADLTAEIHQTAQNSIGMKWPVHFSITRAGGTVSGTTYPSKACTGTISQGGTVTYASGGNATVPCGGSGPAPYDRVKVHAEATTNLMIPPVLFDADFPVAGEGVFRCEFD